MTIRVGKRKRGRVAMLNPKQLEEYYKEYTANLSQWLHDGVVHVNLNLLHEMGLLREPQNGEEEPDDLTQYFHVIESSEKVTLFNDQFVIWIIPRMDQEIPSTYVIIALNQVEKPHPEVVFSTSGIYNSPHFVLKVLQNFLIDMLETEATLTEIKKHQ
jgi:hypothetical protein